MKFSLKLLLWTLIVIAIGLGFSGYLFVNHIFKSSLSREVIQAQDENSILSFALETASLNVPARYDVLQDATVEQIGYNLENGSRSAGRLIRISDETQRVLYASAGFGADAGLLAESVENTGTYRLLYLNGQYFVQTSAVINALDKVLYLETMKDISPVFAEREEGFSMYRRVTVVVLIFALFCMSFISSWLTAPIRLLTRATKRMSYGEYDYRAKVLSHDELGQLTNDFNRMADVLEENISKLETEVRAREDFVGAFAHELKTPLTSIIGYADMLRSRRLDEEKSFKSANYIYTEGKRLEAMSLHLLDLIVTKRQELEFQLFSVEGLIEHLYDMYVTNQNIGICFSFDNRMIRGEPNLIRSVLINLIDNALKASEPGSPIELTGTRLEHGYQFEVRDYGVGIPADEIDKITKAFYMVDKSRARSRNGAGLGLALCVEILQLHGSRLVIESEMGEGTCISFVLPDIPTEIKES